MLQRDVVAPTRVGVVLIIVLMLLTLFAVIGLSFALYGQAAANSSRLQREAEAPTRPDVDPELLLAYFLGQFIYDVPDDASGVYSVLRGHSLARTMYGYHGGTKARSASPLAANIVPFNGVGRLYAESPFPGVNDRQLINYTHYRKDPFLRDPERLGSRPNLKAPRGAYTSGFNAPYTYPDLNSTFLAAVRADGTVLLPSFYRPWASAPQNGQFCDPQTGELNPRWSPNPPPDLPPWFKYTTLRPLPALNPGFPPPEDGGGDVKNLVGGPGTLRRWNGKMREYWNNDSFWMDLGFPVLTAPDGRKFKPLFAPLIIDLDNRVNLNVHGNVSGPGQIHASNQGWGPWEINLRPVLKGDSQEWRKLLTGSPLPPVTGRYGGSPWLGKFGTPGERGKLAPAEPLHHFYSQVDFDGYNEQTGGPSGRVELPGPAPLLSCFPSFGAGYGNASVTERLNHPLLYNPFHSTGDNRSFTVSNLEALLRYGDTGSPALTSRLLRLCPANFADPRIRNLVTTYSMDVDRPGVAPWIHNPQDYPYQAQPATDPDHPALPQGPAILFPSLKDRTGRQVANLPPPDNGEFGGIDWRALSAALGRLDVNRPLPPYPHQGSGARPPFGPPLLPRNLQGEVARDIPFNVDFPRGPIWKQFLLAQEARQRLANDIYRRLLVVTGVPPIQPDQNPQAPPRELLTARRWLAQLAVNIVDFIDSDDISTPFCFYTAEDSPLSPPDPGRVDPGRPEGEDGEIQWPLYWVFGTELPRVVVNEVLAEMTKNHPSHAYKDTVRVFVELHNPFPRVLPAGTYQPDKLPVPLAMKGTTVSSPYSPYRILLGVKPAATVLLPKVAAIMPGPYNDNVLGNPATVRNRTTDEDFTATSVSVPAHGPDGPTASQGFLLLGPPNALYDPFEANRDEIPAATPVVRTSGLEYQYTFPIPRMGDTDERSGGIAVVLRRLANPYLPFNGNRNDASYNPYVTIDYVEDIPVLSVSGDPGPLPSTGKLQPYAAHRSQLRGQQPCSFGKQNAPAPQHYDWLVHLDRPLISPIELLHVSGYQPYQLTQRFMTVQADGRSPLPFGHRAPWLDEDLQEDPSGGGSFSSGLASHRLYRLFEFLETAPLSAGVAAGGRIPGKININTVWDLETLQALCDAQPPGTSGPNHFSDADIQKLFAQMIAPGNSPARTQGAGGKPGSNDRPFWPLSVGTIPPGGQFPHGGGVRETVLRLLAPSPTGHPYLNSELLTKICNQLTTRSNVFAVWLTVGFFEVTDDAPRPVQLGAEIGRSENRHVRHRMFTIIDRTNLSIASCVAELAQPIALPLASLPLSGATPSLPQTVALNQVEGTTLFPVAGPAIRWRIDVGTLLVVDTGADQETVQVLAVHRADHPPTITARFTKSHAAGAAIALADTPGEPPIFLKPLGVEEVAQAFRSSLQPIALTVEIDPRRSNPNTLAGDYDGTPWKLSPGAKLIVDSGPNQEVVTVLPAHFTIDPTAGTGTFQVVMAKPHDNDFSITNTLLGNPGSQQRFNPRDPAYSSVVRYLSIIE